MRNQPPVSITKRLPSASSNTSVGWKFLSSLVRKSSVLHLKPAPAAFENMPLNAMPIELGGEKIVLIFLAERRGPIVHQPRGGDPAEVFDRGQQIAGARNSFDTLCQG